MNRTTTIGHMAAAADDRPFVPCSCGKHRWNAKLGTWCLVVDEQVPAPKLDSEGKFSASGTSRGTINMKLRVMPFRDEKMPPCAPGAQRSPTPNQHLRILQPGRVATRR
jgi:hypothetical protein